MAKAGGEVWLLRMPKNAARSLLSQEKKSKKITSLDRFGEVIL